jgi:hypothetical protein
VALEEFTGAILPISAAPLKIANPPNFRIGLVISTVLDAYIPQG